MQSCSVYNVHAIHCNYMILFIHYQLLIVIIWPTCTCIGMSLLCFFPYLFFFPVILIICHHYSCKITYYSHLFIKNHPFFNNKTTCMYQSPTAWVLSTDDKSLIITWNYNYICDMFRWFSKSMTLINDQWQPLFP